MATPTKYTYSIAADITAQKIDPTRLTKELTASSIIVALDHIDTIADVIDIWFKDALSTEDHTTLYTVLHAHSGEPLIVIEPKTSDGRTRVSAEKGDSTKVTVVSHDWTDPTTWAESAVRVVDEIASDDGAHSVYSLAYVNVIDTYHGKLWQEDFTVDGAGHSYRVAVKVNDVAKVEQDPHFNSGGDFTVNYATGKITFPSGLSPSDVVKVTYHYANGSTFTLKPAAGKNLKLEFAEVQFSADIELTDSVVFQPYGFVEVFAPGYCTTNGGPYPPGTRIPLGNPVVYKTMSDYQNDAVKSYPTYPAIGGNGWRGSPQPIVILDWDYVSSTMLCSEKGMEIRLSLQHDAPFVGWYATATFYCISEVCP